MDKKHRKTAKFLQESRRALKLTQEQMAKFIGASQSHYCNMEKGRRGLPGRFLIEINEIKESLNKGE